MEYLLTGQEMKQLDTYAIENIGLPSVVLMECAAGAVARQVLSVQPQSVLVVCGTGNNGADGLAVCRMLRIQGVNCDYTVIGNLEKITEEFGVQRRILDSLGVETVETPVFHRYDVIVDALFGVGLRRDVQGVFAEAVQAINDAHKSVIAVDIPSGVNSDNGQICGVAVRADVTVTFGYRKVGLIQYPGKEYVGQLVVADIGYPKHLCELLGFHRGCVVESDWNKIPGRLPYGNKGTFGKILVIAGSQAYCGAAVLAVKAAYRMGAGMVKVITHEKNREVIYNRVPEVLAEFYEEQWSEAFEEEYVKSIQWADVVAIGPGLSGNAMAKQLLVKLLDCTVGKRVVIDADALNLMAEDRMLLEKFRSDIIITPHHKEMSRLNGCSVNEIKENPEKVAVEFAKKYGCNVVLKDAVTIVTNGNEIRYNLAGNSGMATAGSGDVLTGIVAAACTWEIPINLAAALAVSIHASAGDVAADHYGEAAVMASDIIDGLRDLDRKLRG